MPNDTPASHWKPVSTRFFHRDPRAVACALLGKLLAHWVDGQWRAAVIVETEAYYRAERGSHASLGWSPSRKALFTQPGVVYMYHARGGASLNFCCAESGNAVLIKAGRVWGLQANERCLVEAAGFSAAWQAMCAAMHAANLLPKERMRPLERLCAGQVLLCRAMGLRVRDWDGVRLHTALRADTSVRAPWTLPPPQNAHEHLQLWEIGLRPAAVWNTPRLGIPPGRDEDMPYRFVDAAYTHAATQNPLRMRHTENALREIAVPRNETAWEETLGPAAHLSRRA